MAKKIDIVWKKYYWVDDGFGFGRIVDGQINVTFTHCRESFARRWTTMLTTGKRTNLMFFKDVKWEMLALFLKKLEDELKLEVKSVVGPTNLSNAAWIEVSPWWIEYPVRRAFFTMALRAARNYNGGDFATTLYACSYAKQTTPAVKLFLRGHTVPTTRIGGWVSSFSRRYRYRWGLGYGREETDTTYLKRISKMLKKAS